MAILVDNQNNKIFLNGVEIASSTGLVGGSVNITPYNTITATDLQTALEQLADQFFRTTSTPTGSNISEGDLWYNPSNNQLKVYREVSPATFEWVYIMVGDDSDSSDNIDAGAF